MHLALPAWLRRRWSGDPYRLVRHDTEHGVYYLPSLKTDIVANAMRRGQVFDEKIVRLARKHSSPGSVMLDVGANFGQMAVLFSRMVGPQGRVFAFEADEFVFDVLRRNVEANGASNVTPVFGAVYDQSAMEMTFPVPDFVEFGTFGSYGLDPHRESGRKVKSLAIDDLDIPGPVSFMKVDVQGSDLAAMRGARATILRNRMPIVFEYEARFLSRFDVTFDDYSRFIDSIDYRITDVVHKINYLIVPR